LLANKLRAVLALLSIAVGVAALILTSAVGAGARAEVLRKMQSMGTNLLIVRPALVRNFAARKTIRGVVTSLKLEDYEAVAGLRIVVQSAPGAEGMMKVKAGASTVVTKVLGTTPAFPFVRNFELRAGRFFDDTDNQAARRVAVLGSRVAEALFPQTDALGREIRVRGVPFDVVGVLQAKGAQIGGADEDNQVIVPIRTALRRVFNRTWITDIFVSLSNSQQMEAGQREIGDLLRARHRMRLDGQPDDFAIQNTTQSLNIQQRTARSLELLASALGALTLAIGGAGILALMLLSVKERTAEIGLRMAVGATPRDIFIQFLLEAIWLAVGGWVLGLALGVLAATGVMFGTNWKVGWPMDALFASAAMALIIGLLFGAVPARRASLMPPIRALVTV
jgi:putative ABC transport system permease protein